MISLLELDPDFVALVPAGEHEIARAVSLPVHTVDGEAGADVGALLGEAGAFGAVILDGWLMHRLRVGD